MIFASMASQKRKNPLFCYFLKSLIRNKLICKRLEDLPKGRKTTLRCDDGQYTSLLTRWESGICLPFFYGGTLCLYIFSGKCHISLHTYEVVNCLRKQVWSFLDFVLSHDNLRFQHRNSNCLVLILEIKLFGTIVGCHCLVGRQRNIFAAATICRVY